MCIIKTALQAVIGWLDNDMNEQAVPIKMANMIMNRTEQR